MLHKILIRSINIVFQHLSKHLLHMWQLEAKRKIKHQNSCTGGQKKTFKYMFQLQGIQFAVLWNLLFFNPCGK